MKTLGEFTLISKNIIDGELLWAQNITLRTEFCGNKIKSTFCSKIAKLNVAKIAPYLAQSQKKENK